MRTIFQVDSYTRINSGVVSNGLSLRQHHNLLWCSGTVFFLLIAMVAVAFWGCGDDDDYTYNGLVDTFWVEIMVPEVDDTIIGSFLVRAEANGTPDYIMFEFDTLEPGIDSLIQFYAYFDVSLYPSGTYSVLAIAHWGEIEHEDEVSFFIQAMECDPTEPVILNGDTIPESRITRNELGCVTSIRLYYLEISDPNYLSGIEEYAVSLTSLTLHDCSIPLSIDLSPLASCTNLEKLYIDDNNLTSIDLSPIASCENLNTLNISYNQQLDSLNLTPLSSCPNLMDLDLSYNRFSTIDLNPLSSCLDLHEIELNDNQLDSIDLWAFSSYTQLCYLNLESNNLTSIDLSPLWYLDNLREIRLNYNDLDPASCAHVCDFIDTHPSEGPVRLVYSDCSCP